MSTQTQAEKALLLCQKQYHLKEDIKKITRQIGAQLDDCQTSQGNSLEHKPHLREWFQSGGDKYEQDKYIGKCKHCQIAYSLIQDRKKLRFRLGAIRGHITKLGRESTP